MDRSSRTILIGCLIVLAGLLLMCGVALFVIGPLVSKGSLSYAKFRCCTVQYSPPEANSVYEVHFRMTCDDVWFQIDDAAPILMKDIDRDLIEQHFGPMRTTDDGGAFIDRGFTRFRFDAAGKLQYATLNGGEPGSGQEFRIGLQKNRLIPMGASLEEFKQVFGEPIEVGEQRVAAP